MMPMPSTTVNVATPPPTFEVDTPVALDTGAGAGARRRQKRRRDRSDMGGRVIRLNKEFGRREFRAPSIRDETRQRMRRPVRFIQSMKDWQPSQTPLRFQRPGHLKGPAMARGRRIFQDDRSGDPRKKAPRFHISVDERIRKINRIIALGGHRTTLGLKIIADQLNLLPSMFDMTDSQNAAVHTIQERLRRLLLPTEAESEADARSRDDDLKRADIAAPSGRPPVGLELSFDEKFEQSFAEQFPERARAERASRDPFDEKSDVPSLDVSPILPHARSQSEENSLRAHGQFTPKARLDPLRGPRQRAAPRRLGQQIIPQSSAAEAEQRERERRESDISLVEDISGITSSLSTSDLQTLASEQRGESKSAEQFEAELMGTRPRSPGAPPAALPEPELDTLADREEKRLEDALQDFTFEGTSVERFRNLRRVMELNGGSEIFTQQSFGLENTPKRKVLESAFRAWVYGQRSKGTGIADQHVKNIHGEWMTITEMLDVLNTNQAAGLSLVRRRFVTVEDQAQIVSSEGSRRLGQDQSAEEEKRIKAQQKEMSERIKEAEIELEALKGQRGPEDESDPKMPPKPAGFE